MAKPRTAPDAAEPPGRLRNLAVPTPVRHAVDVALDGVATPVACARLEELAGRVLLAEHVPRAMLSITLVSTRTMARLHYKHLGVRGPTDVITFALGDDGSGVLVADIYICPEIAREHARRFGVGMREELARLVVHGTLHACGWDHPTDATREGSDMWKRQERLLARWLASSRAAE